ncbi:hypothetical protein VOLCADRAFT_79148 [Volvox carteri f. nagariensis]|uniref:Small-subunit processome Utp12 domain-containing protein n=1 Tax=Volvox carteri f. nagariensis TaxID=3068 RepID=D8TJD1_VOLCA|nr:uncharacterized protein VOLCADRAFT_79148 [Volvox carteri f. nagariensis]EFJ52522.1 hypothetical protein VOLCADRAFT_79148 [Volvox carteri f. nagariensis]|eukprot:XP_002946595.1 hypothetical protein VOLCADRAFT_79148 [Volvox carteri f. nagariensis]
MVKAYLRYEFSAAFGVITSSANPTYDASGKLLFTASLENISVWNAKQGSLVRQLSPVVTSTSTGSGASGGGVAEVTVLCCAPGSATIAAGYSDGTVRLWDYLSGECSVTFRGHKTAVSCLRYNGGGSLLVSGGRDTDLVVWDVVGETGLYRLKGHKDQVTDVSFLPGQSKLVSCSKDGLVKVWDLDTQHCCQTLTGHKAEVWSLDVNPAGTRLATGSTDNEIRVFAAVEVTGGGGAPAAGGAAPGREDRDHIVLVAMGSVRRGAAAHERVAMLRFSGDGEWLGVQAAGKGLELFRVRDEDEARKKLKRRKRRRKEKVAKKAAGRATTGTTRTTEVTAAVMMTRTTQRQDWAYLLAVSKGAKIKAFCFAPPAVKLAAGVACRLVLSLSNNCIEILNVASETHSYDTASRIDLGGHRSDVRALSLSSDDSALLTASSAALKLWNPRTGSCLATMDSGYGLCVLFAPGNKFAVIGTKEGTLEVFDLGAATRVHVEEGAHGGAVWALAPLPNKTGFFSGAADKTVKLWHWSVVSLEGGSKSLRLAHVRTVPMADDVLAVRCSPDGKLLAVALLDATVKVYFADSMKFFLSLYGHKLPVLCMDISSDSSMLLTGSSDKNIKVWGLDFGDCHKSLFAHGDAVMSVAWVPGTHYAFSAGKDRLLKYWDLDRFELLLELPGHHGEVWCCGVSQFGDFVITGSHDRSIRRWERTAEPFFVEEERERRLESLFEADMETTAADRDAAAGAAGNDATGTAAATPAGRRTLEAVSAADAIIDALEAAALEMDRLRTADRERAEAAAAGRPPPQPLPPNALLAGLAPSAYVLKVVSGVRASELEQAVMMLPFADALRLLGYLPQWLQAGGPAVELTVRLAVLLVRLHQGQLVATAAARPVLLALQRRLRGAAQGLKDVVGFNLAAMSHLTRRAREREGVTEADVIVPAKRQLLGKGA